MIDRRAEIAKDAILNRYVVLGSAVIGPEYDITDSIVTGFKDGSIHITQVTPSSLELTAHPVGVTPPAVQC